MISRGQIAGKVRSHKEKYPSQYCPVKGCLWRTKNGDYCPKHTTDVSPNGVAESDSYTEGARMEEELELADTPEEIQEDSNGWQRGVDHDGLLETVETVFVSFDKPLKPESERTLALLMERYTDDKGQPLVKFDSNKEDPNEGWIALHIPRVIKPTFLNASADIEAETSEVLRLSGNGR